jgi:hypothetical protein
MSHKDISAENKALAKSILKKLEFKSDTQMVVRIDHTRDILEWGRKNNQPDYYLGLFKGQPQHASIVSGKAKYLTGTSISGSTPIADEWLNKANQKESWQQLRKKYNKDKTLYGGYALKIVPNALGVPLWYFHVGRGKLRPSVCGMFQDYCDDWQKQNGHDAVRYPVWYPGCREVAIFLADNYNPSNKTIESMFPALEYESGLRSIDTLKRIQNYKNSLVANNFSSGTIVEIKSGKAKTPAEEADFSERLKGEHTGDEKAGNTVILFSDPGPDSLVNINQISPNDLDKQFIEVTKSETINVYGAHDVPAELFNYISDTSKVFEVNKVVEQNELFMNSYVIPTQEPEMESLKVFFRLRTGQEAEFDIEQFDPIGLDLPLDNQVVVDALNAKDPNIIPNWLNKKYKLGMVEAAPAPVIPGTVQQAQGPVNEHLKNLTGKHSQGIDRIVRKFKAGTYSEGQATILLKGFGLTDSDIKEFLGITPPPAGAAPIQQRIALAQENKWSNALRRHMVTIPDEDIILDTKLAKYTPEVMSVTELRNSILNQLKGNPAMSIEELAENFQIGPLEVQTEIEWLIEKKFLDSNESGFTPTEKAVKKDTQETEFEFYTVYTFGLRADVTGPVIKPTTRQWCRDTYAAFRSKRNALTIDAIEDMTNEFGMNAFDYRGGFYTEPGTDNTTPWCRHAWYAHTVSRKKKK